jgi:hypothetical protein
LYEVTFFLDIDLIFQSLTLNIQQQWMLKIRPGDRLAGFLFSLFKISCRLNLQRSPQGSVLNALGWNNPEVGMIKKLVIKDL